MHINFAMSVRLFPGIPTHGNPSQQSSHLCGNPSNNATTHSDRYNRNFAHAKIFDSRRFQKSPAPFLEVKDQTVSKLPELLGCNTFPNLV